MSLKLNWPCVGIDAAHCVASLLSDQGLVCDRNLGRVGASETAAHGDAGTLLGHGSAAYDERRDHAAILFSSGTHSASQ